jgi:hypothetical protein
MSIVGVRYIHISGAKSLNGLSLATTIRDLATFQFDPWAVLACPAFLLPEGWGCMPLRLSESCGPIPRPRELCFRSSAPSKRTSRLFNKTVLIDEQTVSRKLLLPTNSKHLPTNCFVHPTTPRLHSSSVPSRLRRMRSFAGRLIRGVLYTREIVVCSIVSN